jgi:vanillate monooxygenase ferredoxin subunit
MQGDLRTVRVARKTIDATDVCTFELVHPDGAALPPFAAGAHIDVHIAPDLVRQYSLCGDPADHTHYLIAVLRAPDGRGGSSAMHDAIHEGQEIWISEPRNCFPLAPETQPSLLLAGGIGVTPILSMAERLNGIGTVFEMHYLTRSRERTAFYERIAHSPFAANVTFHHDDGPAEQRLDIPAVLERHKGRSHLYLCGPEGFLTFVRDTARQRGWPDEAVHFEYFSAQPARSDHDRAFVVELASTGQRVSVPSHQSVVEALATHGVDIPISCGQGVCGTCLTRILGGEPDHRDYYLSAKEQARNDQFLPCCSRAKGAFLILDL